MAEHDGGSAFPFHIDKSAIATEDFPGMSLRDWFAGQALASMGKLLPDVWNEHDCGKIAYIIADAMLKERAK